MSQGSRAGGIAAATLGIVTGLLYMEALPPGSRIEWLVDYEEARTLASRDDRPLLVDFGASWCGACGELDRHTFSDPRVVAAAQGFVPVRIDLSPGEDTPEKRAILASYEQRGLPLVVLHGRDGQEAARVTTFVEAERFLEIRA